jgi:hypothetical protein
MSINSSLRLIALSLALVAPLAGSARANTQNSAFDGQWVVDVPPYQVITGVSEYVCPALRLPVRIESGKLVGTLMPVPRTIGGSIVESGTGRLASAITGEVAPDGSVHAQWQNYHADGQLTGDAGLITVQTHCGPMLSTAVRIGR